VIYLGSSSLPDVNKTFVLDVLIWLERSLLGAIGNAFYHFNRVERTVCSFNTVVKPVVQSGLTAGRTNSCSFHTVVKPFVKPI